MSKRKDAVRREALETAFFILTNSESPDAAAEDGADFPEDGNPTERLAAKLIRGVLDRREEIDSLLRKLSPAWLLERLSDDDKTLLRLAFVCVIEEGISPKATAAQLMALAERKARWLAFQTLYGLSFIKSPSLADARGMYSRCATRLESDEDEPRGRAWNVVRGVLENDAMVDGLIGKFSRNWRLDRMGAIERTILRMSLYELVKRLSSPERVIEDAMETAAQFGAGSARKFIRGVLNACARAMAQGEDLGAGA